VKPPEPPAPESVLILKPSSLGDVVGALPVLRGLRRSFPGARLAWLVTPQCAPVLDGQAELDEVIVFDRRRYGKIARSPAAAREFLRFCRELRHRRFDWAIDLQGLFRSGFLARATGANVRAGFADARELAGLFYTHRVPVAAVHTIDRNVELARALGVDARGDDLNLTVTDRGRAFVESLLDARGVQAGRYVVAAPGTRWANKLYPVRLWRKVVAELAANVPVMVVGADGEKDLCAAVAEGLPNAMDLGGRTDLPQLAALIASAGALVCCDSAANFIAPAVGTGSVTLMGPTRPERTGPYGPRGRALTAEIPCLGCLRRACPHATCMQWIDPGDVAAAAREILEKATRPPSARGTVGEGASR